MHAETPFSLPISRCTVSPRRALEPPRQWTPDQAHFYTTLPQHTHFAQRGPNPKTSAGMQTQVRAPAGGRAVALSRQSVQAPAQRASLALPRTASRHSWSLAKSDSDAHALYAERLPGTTNFAAASTSRCTVLCGPGIAHPSEVCKLPLARLALALSCCPEMLTAAAWLAALNVPGIDAIVLCGSFERASPQLASFATSVADKSRPLLT